MFDAGVCGPIAHAKSGTRVCSAIDTYIPSSSCQPGLDGRLGTLASNDLSHLKLDYVINGPYQEPRPSARRHILVH